MKRVIVAFLSIALLCLVFGNTICAEEGQQQFAGFLNINTASYEQLIMLPDMSETLARNIITYRNMNGPLATIDELIMVNGFEYTYIDRIRPFLQLEGDNTLRPVE